MTPRLYFASGIGMGLVKFILAATGKSSSRDNGAGIGHRSLFHSFKSRIKQQTISLLNKSTANPDVNLIDSEIIRQEICHPFKGPGAINSK